MCFPRAAFSLPLIAVLLLALAFPVLASPPKRPPVLLLSIDGLRPDMVWQADRYGLRIPNLRRLARTGAGARSLQHWLPTLTYCGHTTLVTGVPPERHGILNNQPFDPLDRNQRGWYWYAQDIRRPTLWQVARRAGLRVGAVDWPVTVGAAIDYLIPQFWRASTTDDRKLLRALSTPGLLDQVEKAVGPYPAAADYDLEGDRARAQSAAWVMRRYRPDLMLAYLGSVDHEEHATGPFSPETKATLESVDQLIGQLWEAAGGEEAVLVLVSDHGFAPLEKGVFLNARLLQEGFLLFRDGRPWGWQARLWSALGSGAVMVAPDCPPERRERLRQILDEIVQAGVGQIVEPQQAGGFPGAAWVVLLRPGYSLWPDPSPGPLLRDIPDRGAHGYSPDLPDMDACFFAAGPGIRAGQDLGRMDACDVAPTVARLLGLRMEQTQGQARLP